MKATGVKLGKTKNSNSMATDPTLSKLGATVTLDPSPVLHLLIPDAMIPHRPKSLSHSFATPSPLDALPSLTKEKTVPHQLSYQPSKYTGRIFLKNFYVFLCIY